MKEEIVVPKTRPLQIKNLLGKNRWIQIIPEEITQDIGGKYHPKLTFFYIGNQDGIHSYKSELDYAIVIDMYGHRRNEYCTTVCRQFPDTKQLLLMEEYGETLLEYLKEHQIETIIEELKLKCKV